MAAGCKIPVRIMGKVNRGIVVDSKDHENFAVPEPASMGPSKYPFCDIAVSFVQYCTGRIVT